MSDEQKGPRWITAAEVEKDTHPITLVPGDVVLQDANGELLEYSGEAIYYVTPIRSGRNGYFAVFSTDEITMLKVGDDGTIELTCLDGNTDNRSGQMFLSSGIAFDDGNSTPADGGDLFVSLGSGVNGGRNGNFIIQDGGNVPAAADDPGSTGAISWDADFIYVCVSDNTWKRATLSTWP